MRNRSLLLLVLPFLLCAGNVWGVTYYVDQRGGNDANTGTSTGNAWKTVAKVNSSSFLPGDYILFKRGEVWRDVVLVVPSSGSAGNPITFGAYGTGANPVISGANILTSWTQEDQGGWYAYYTTGSVDPYIVIADTTLYPLVASKAALTTGTYWWDSGNSRVYVRTTGDNNPSNYTMQLPQRGNTGVIDINNRSYITFDGIDAKHSRDSGYSNYSTGGSQTDITIKNATTTLHGGEGIVLSGNNKFYNVLIDNMVISWTNYRENANCNAGQALSIWSDSSPNSADGFEIKNCNVSHQKEEGIMVGGGATNGSVHNNVVHDFEGSCGSRPAFYIMNQTNTVWYNNAAYNIHDTATPNWAGCYFLAIEGWMSTSTINNVTLHNNLCYDSDIGISLYKKTADTFSNISILNNTFVNLRNTTYAFQFHSSLGSNYSGTNNIKNNIFWDVDAGNVILDGTTGNSAISKTSITNNLFQTGDSSETFGTSYVQTSDVRFSNYAGKNFTLQSNSLAIDTGTDVGLTIDYVGNPIPYGAAPDIGAYEYTSLNTSIPTAPANLSATPASPSQITLSWMDQSTNETAFLIERMTGAGGTYAQTGTAAANATTYGDSGLAEGTTYFYRVVAVNGAGYPAYSNEASATTPVSLSPKIPLPPSDIRISP